MMRTSKFLVWTSPITIWAGAVWAVVAGINGASLGEATGIFGWFFLTFITQILAAIALYVIAEKEEEARRRGVWTW